MTDHTAITRHIDQGPSATLGGYGKRRISRPIALLMEDEPLISMDVETTLSDAGFEVHSVMSCADAHDWLNLHRPDVVIVDIVLRDGECAEVVSRLLEGRIPFIVHSGADQDRHSDTPFHLGAWVPKPSVPIALVLAVNAAAAAQTELVDASSAGELLGTGF